MAGTPSKISRFRISVQPASWLHPIDIGENSNKKLICCQHSQFSFLNQKPIFKENRLRPRKHHRGLRIAGIEFIGCVAHSSFVFLYYEGCVVTNITGKENAISDIADFVLASISLLSMLTV